MILTQIFVVLCSLSGEPCSTYVHSTLGVLSVDGCERAIQGVAREHAHADTALQRARSYCERMPINTSNDIDS